LLFASRLTHRHLTIRRLLKGPASLPCFVLLGLLMAATKILAVKACTSTHLALLPRLFIKLPKKSLIIPRFKSIFGYFYLTMPVGGF
jgi:hypothetical protein